MKSEYKRKLRNKAIVFSTSFAVLLSILIGGLGYFQYKDNIEASYENYADSLVAIIRSKADVTNLQACIRTGEMDDSFTSLQQEVNRIKTNTDARYIYMFHYPKGVEEGTIAYVMNAYTQQELEKEGSEIRYLGDLAGKEDFSPEMKTVLKEGIEKKDEQIRFFNNSTKVTADALSATEYVKTAFVPIRTEGGELVSVLCLDISMTRIYENLHSYVVTIVVGAACVVVVFLLIFITIMNRKVINPIKKIAGSADDFVKQSYRISDPSEFIFQEVKVQTQDEIELLSNSLNHMMHETINFMMEMKHITGEKERMAAEMDVAKQIQTNLYPCFFPAFPERKDFDIYAKLEFAQEGGGDFYNFFFTDSSHLCIITGRVSETGIPTTMLAAISSTLIKNYAQLGYAPGRIFAETNNQISKSNQAELDVSAFLGIIDLNTGRMDYANAGEMVPLIKKSGSKFETLANKRSIRMGAMENIPFFQESLLLVQGDILFLYTPGVAETVDGKDNVYSDTYVRERMDDITKREIELNRMTQALSEDVSQFRNGAIQQKDYTMLLLRYYGK